MIGNPKSREQQAPVPGRIVMLHEAQSTPPSVAIITHVWNPGLVNLTVFDPMGKQTPLNATSVVFSADGTQPHGSNAWATWPGLPARAEPEVEPEPTEVVAADES
jgi:hypothetical protein